MAILLKGAEVASAINERSQNQLRLMKVDGISPTLAIVRVGEREDDIAYENGAAKRCEKVGVAVLHVVLPDDVSQETLTFEIEKLNRDSSVHGVLIFMPLPKHLDSENIRRVLSPKRISTELPTAPWPEYSREAVRAFHPAQLRPVWRYSTTTKSTAPEKKPWL